MREIGTEPRVTLDARTGVIRSWYDPAAAPRATPPFPPFAVAREFLLEYRERLGLGRELRDIRERLAIRGVHGVSVRFAQELHGIPVEPGEVVVNLHNDSRVYSLYSQYDPTVATEMRQIEPRVQAAEAWTIGAHLARVYGHSELSPPRLLIYRYRDTGDGPPPPARPRRQRERFLATVAVLLADAPPSREGRYYLVWDMRLRTVAPKHEWRILVDAVSGNLLAVRDVRSYATPSGRVFDPNPVVTTGDLQLSSSTPVRRLDAARRSVTLERLAGTGYLDGDYVQMENLVPGSSASAEPKSLQGHFNYSSANPNFLFVMAYHHVDRFQGYIRGTLGLTSIAPFSVKVDPVDESGWDDSSGAASGISLGAGKVSDASDAMIILHEYGHVMQDSAVQGSNLGNLVGGVGEGFADFVAAVYFDDRHQSLSSPTRGVMFSWNTNAVDYPGQARRYDVPWHFDDPDFTLDRPHRGYIRGQLWCATLFEIYRKLGGDSSFLGTRHAARDLILRLHLMANFHVLAQDWTCALMGHEIDEADAALDGWRYPDALHGKLIRATFARRRLPEFPSLPIDLYVDDGRDGGYGSLSGQDLFAEVLWPDAFWETEDIWLRAVPYPGALAQAAGSPADHVVPVAGQATHAYVRVKCRGDGTTPTSGPVTVKVFHAAPGAGLLWPADWIAATTSAGSLPGIPAGGSAVAGPFGWIAAEGGDPALLAVVESTEDPALTQTLQAGASVAEADLIPVDNNIARRSIATFAPQGKTLRGLFVRNPHAEPKVATLHARSTLPPGWRWKTKPAMGTTIALPPRAQARIDVTINQAQGAAITNFAPAPSLALMATIDDVLVGGLTLRAAPA